MLMFSFLATDCIFVDLLFFKKNIMYFHEHVKNSFSVFYKLEHLSGSI